MTRIAGCLIFLCCTIAFPYHRATAGVGGSATEADENLALPAEGDLQGETQAFEVYDEITESLYENFRVYHPYECRQFFVRKQRGDGKTYVDKVRRCD